MQPERGLITHPPDHISLCSRMLYFSALSAEIRLRQIYCFMNTDGCDSVSHMIFKSGENDLETFLQKQGSEILPGTRAGCRITPPGQTNTSELCVTATLLLTTTSNCGRAHTEHTPQVHLQKPVAILQSACEVIYSKDSECDSVTVTSSS